MDIIKKYKKQKKVKTISIVLTSLMIAVSINFFLFYEDSITDNIKANILESEKKQNIWDIFLEENQNWSIILKSNKEIINIKNINLSIVYNPENIDINNVSTKIDWEISNISNTKWINTIIIQSSKYYNVKPGQDIVEINLDKKNETSENINIINANFTDMNDDTFELQSSWIVY